MKILKLFYQKVLYIKIKKKVGKEKILAESRFTRDEIEKEVLNE